MGDVGPHVGGNIQPQLDVEEHQHLARAKRVVITGSDGVDYIEMKVNADGSINTTGGGGGGGSVTQGTIPWDSADRADKVEDAASVDGATGMFILAVRNSAPMADLTNVTGDYSGIAVDVKGRVAVDISNVTSAAAMPVTVGNTVTVQTGSNSLHIDDNSGSISVDDGGGSLTVDGTVTATTSLTTKDYDTGAGTDTAAVVGILLPKSGGSVAGGTSTDPIRIDPTGTTAQPITDNAGSLTVDGTVAVSSVAGTVTVDTELPAAALLANGISAPTTSTIGAFEYRAKVVDGTTTYDLAPASYYQNRASVGNLGGAGTAVDMTANPMSKFGLEIENASGTTSAWNINLEGSMDNTSYFTLTNQTSATGNPQLSFIADKPVRYMRSNVTSVTGGGNVRIRIIALDH